MVFINGLRSISAKFVLEELKPRTLDEAYSLIKDEKLDAEEIESPIYAFNESKPNCFCYKKIEQLKEKIDELEKKLSPLFYTTRQEKFLIAICQAISLETAKKSIV